MAEETTPVAGTEKVRPFVALNPNEPVMEEDDAPETADETPEPETAEGQEAASDEEGFPGDELKYDPNDPVQKAAYEELRKQLLPKWQKRIEAVKAKVQPKPAEPASADAPGKETPEAAETDSEVGDFYGDPFGDEWRPEGARGFDKESDLAGYEAELDAFVAERVKKAVQHTLATLAKRGQALQAAEQQRQAAGVIEGYMNAIQNHPEYETLYEQLKEIAPGTRDLAMKNPEKWVRMAEALTGVPRDWAGAKDAKDEPEEEASPAASLPARRLAQKPVASLPRTVRAPQTSAAGAAGKLGFDDAFEAAWRRTARR